MELRFSAHVQVVLRERDLREEWVERVLAAPEWVEPDPNDLSLMRAFASLPERGGRILRVVYGERDGMTFVVTAFLDRGARRP